MMIKKHFNDGIFKVQQVFNSEYSKPMMDAIFFIVQKWRESTWSLAVNFIIGSFKPGYNYQLPVPADWKKAYTSIPIEDDYVPIKRQDNGVYATPEEIAAIFKPVLKKLCHGKTFRLKTSHVEGRFACEVCHRAGCEGASISRMKNGCGAFLSEEAAGEIAEKFKIEREEMKAKTGCAI